MGQKMVIKSEHKHLCTLHICFPISQVLFILVDANNMISEKLGQDVTKIRAQKLHVSLF